MTLTPCVDKLTGQAKHSAWYDSPDDDTNIRLPIRNPFGKYRSNTANATSRSSALKDEEQEVSGGLQKLHSAPEPSDPTDLVVLESIPSKDDDEDKALRERQPKKQTAEVIVEPPITPTKFKFTVGDQFKAIIFGGWVNLLLVFVPIGFVAYYLHLDASTVFALNFVAIMPSIMMVSFAVDEIQLRTGDLIGALLNMSFSNAAQLISSILLLRSRQITVLKTSLLGSIISNLLLMLGLCMFFGGINRITQYFNQTVAQTISMMLLLAILSLVVPTASHLMASVSQHNIVVQSRGTSVVVIFSYGLYLFFQLKTHTIIFNEPSAKARTIPSKPIIPERFRRSKLDNPVSTSTEEKPPSIASEEMNKKDEPQLHIYVATTVLILFTVFIAFNAEFATSSIQSMVHQADNLTQTFVGFVILPILTNDPLSIINAMKDRMDFSIAMTLERCMQTALLVVPLVVIIAWGMGVEEMTLEFDGFSISATFISILIVTYVVQDGSSNWLVGALLVKVYIIVALATYFVHT